MERNNLTNIQQDFITKIEDFKFYEEEASLSYKSIFTDTYDIEKRFGIKLTAVKDNSSDNAFMYYQYPTIMTLFDENDENFDKNIENCIAKFSKENDLIALDCNRFGYFYNKNEEKAAAEKLASLVVKFQNSVERKLPDIVTVGNQIKYFIQNNIPAPEWEDEEFITEKRFWTPYVDSNNRVIEINVTKESDNVFSLYADNNHIDDLDEDDMPQDRIVELIKKIRNETGVGGEEDVIAFENVNDLNKINEYVEIICKSVLLFQEKWKQKNDLFSEKTDSDQIENTYNNTDANNSTQIIENDKYIWWVHPYDSWSKLIEINPVSETKSDKELYELIKQFSEGENRFLYIKTDKYDLFDVPFCFIIEKNFPNELCFQNSPSLWTPELENKPCTIYSSTLQTWEFTDNNDLEETVDMLSAAAKKHRISNTGFDKHPFTKKPMFTGLPEVFCRFGKEDNVEDIINRIYSCIIEFQSEWIQKHGKYGDQRIKPEVSEQNINEQISVEDLRSWYDSAVTYDNTKVTTTYSNYDGIPMVFTVVKTPTVGEIRIESSRKDIEDFFFVTNTNNRVTDLLADVAKKYNVRVIEDLEGCRLGIETKIEKAAAAVDILAVCILEFERLSQNL